MLLKKKTLFLAAVLGMLLGYLNLQNSTPNSTERNNHVEEQLSSFVVPPHSAQVVPVVNSRRHLLDVVESTVKPSHVGTAMSQQKRKQHWINDWNVVHVVNTRFMQHQGGKQLLHLAQARLDLFEAFTLPSIKQQSNQQFLWLIWTDAQLDHKILEQLQRLLKDSSLHNVVVLSAKAPTGQKAAGHNLRTAYGVGSLSKLSNSVLYGDANKLREYHAASMSHVLLETNLDADDALSSSFLESAQVQAAFSVGQQHGQGHVEVLCPRAHAEWRYYETKAFSSEGYPPEGTQAGELIHMSNPNFCIGSGTTTVFSVFDSLQRQLSRVSRNLCTSGQDGDRCDVRRNLLPFLEQQQDNAHSHRRRLSEPEEPKNMVAAMVEPQYDLYNHRQLQLSADKELVADLKFEFFVPLDEQLLYDDALELLMGGDPNADAFVASGITISISTNLTVLWYDHHEDGYEDDVTDPETSSTEIWGNGIAADGCRPDIVNCTDDDDYLYAGDHLVLESSVQVRSSSTDPPGGDLVFDYDAGDFIGASSTVAVTRYAYVESLGPDHAGTVEVASNAITSLLGKTFEAPVGPNMGDDSFAVSTMFITSPGTKTNLVTLPNGTVIELNQGECISVQVNQGDIVTTSQNSLAYLVTGDTDADEMRWFSLFPTNRLDKEYYMPVGDCAKILLYNYLDQDITVDFTTLDDNGDEVTISIPVPSKSSVMTPPVGTNGSGAYVKGVSNKKFLALGMTDPSDDSCGNGNGSGSGNSHDWGFPLIGAKYLTSQLQVGLGYRCLGDCDPDVGSSVFITPTDDADIYVDYCNCGDPDLYGVYNASALQSIAVTDPQDNDISGSRIFATAAGTGPNGPGVNIAGAWGSSSDNSSSVVGMGVALLPYPTGGGGKGVSGKARPGSTLTYKITIDNDGPRTYNAGEFIIRDVLPAGVTYVDGSAEYSSDGGRNYVPLDNDTTGSTIFMIDEGGLPSQAALNARGGTHAIIYEVKIDNPLIGIVELVNTVELDFPDDADDRSYTRKKKIDWREDISVTNDVFSGEKSAADCEGLEGQGPSYQGWPGEQVTYCFTVTNNGKTKLSDVKFSNSDLGIGEVFVGQMEVGQSNTFAFTFNLAGQLANVVTATGNPVFDDWTDIWTLDDVVATDPSEVFINTVSPTKNPTSSPTTASPSTSPTTSPTPGPTTSPTRRPTTAPTTAPTPSPTTAPTPSPTTAPTPSPTTAPTPSPTTAPTPSPTTAPTPSPTQSPTRQPTDDGSTDCIRFLSTIPDTQGADMPNFRHLDASVLLARTPTAAGMKNVLPGKKGGGENSKKLSTYASQEKQELAWEEMQQRFGVSKDNVVALRSKMESNMEHILVDAFAGQCTPGHSCKESTKRALGYLLDKEYHRRS